MARRAAGAIGVALSMLLVLGDNTLTDIFPGCQTNQPWPGDTPAFGVKNTNSAVFAKKTLKIPAEV